MAANSWLLLTLWDEFNYIPQKKLSGLTDLLDKQREMEAMFLDFQGYIKVLEFPPWTILWNSCLLSCEKAHATHIKRNQNTQLTALAEFRSRDQNQLIRLVSEPSEGAQSYSLGKQPQLKLHRIETNFPVQFSSVQFSSVAQSCPTLCDPMNRTPGVHSDSHPSSPWCHPAISSSVVPFSSCPQSSQHQSLFQWVNSSHEVAKVLEFQL